MADRESLDGRFLLDPPGKGPWRTGVDSRTGRRCRARAVPEPGKKQEADWQNSLAASLLKARHPSLESLLALRGSEDGKSAWWIYEAAEGKTFAELAEEKRPFREAEAIAITAALVGALRALREEQGCRGRLVISPERLLLTPAGRPVIMAPWPVDSDRLHEQWRPPDRLPADTADLYVAGMSLVYLFSGRPPSDFRGPDGFAGISRYSGFSPEFCAALDKMRPESRGFGTAGELERELGLLLAGRAPSRARGLLRLLLLGCGLAGALAAAVPGLERFHSRGSEATLRGGEVEWAQPGGLAFSPAGDVLALAGDRELYLWTTAAWKRQREMALQNLDYRRFRAAAYFPDGRLAALCYGGASLKVFTGALLPLHDLPLPSEPDSMAISPDGGLLAVAVNDYSSGEQRSYNGRLLLFDGATLKPLPALATPGGPAHSVRFEPGGRALVYRTLHWDGNAKTWNLGRVVRRPLDGGPEEVLFSDPENGFRLGLFALGPGGVAALPRPGSERIDVLGPGGRLLASLNTDSAAESYSYITSSEGAFSPDGKYFAATIIKGGRARLRLYGTDGWKLLREFKMGKWSAEGGVAALAFSPDGRLLAAAQGDARRSKVRVFRVAEGK